MWMFWYSTRRTAVRRPKVLSQMSKGRCHEDKSFSHVPHLISSSSTVASWRRWRWRNCICHPWRGRRRRRIRVRCLTLVCIQVHCLDSFVGTFGLLRSLRKEVLFVQRLFVQRRRRRRHDVVSAMLLLCRAFTLGKFCLLPLIIAEDGKELRVHALGFAPDGRFGLLIGTRVLSCSETLCLCWWRFLHRPRH